MNSYTPPQEPYAPVLFCDDHILIANKPSGLLTVPGRGPEKADCLYSRLQKQFPTVEVVHRLDMETSGIVLFALSKRAQSHLGKAFQQREVYKVYHALVSGYPKEQSGLIDLALIADWPNRPKQKVDPEKGKPALTKWQILEKREACSLIRLMPFTGRSHQLRVHMQAIGHPILGDALYAPPEIIKLADRLQLHASFLSFTHPITHERVEFFTDLPFLRN
ncbi:RluA family pseudouridine synthase [Sneathiella limimaris]|uniref:RluA family pseudouridine synthase n=1 Tax=Sneathiella limimaris TaxID=1964213 RepID=UPI00146A1248|nr:RluA family pseudouridine synthase [Sneathiella limimaris]